MGIFHRRGWEMIKAFFTFQFLLLCYDNVSCPSHKSFCRLFLVQVSYASHTFFIFVFYCVASSLKYCCSNQCQTDKLWMLALKLSIWERVFTFEGYLDLKMKVLLWYKTYLHAIPNMTFFPVENKKPLFKSRYVSMKLALIFLYSLSGYNFYWNYTGYQRSRGSN